MTETEWIAEFRRGLLDQGREPEVADAFIASSTYAELSAGFSDRPLEAAKHVVVSGSEPARRFTKAVNAGFDSQFAWLLISGALLMLAIAFIGDWPPFQFWLLMILAAGFGFCSLFFMRRYHRFVDQHNASLNQRRHT